MSNTIVNKLIFNSHVCLVLQSDNLAKITANKLVLHQTVSVQLLTSNGTFKSQYLLFNFCILCTFTVYSIPKQNNTYYLLNTMKMHCTHCNHYNSLISLSQYWLTNQPSLLSVIIDKILNKNCCNKNELKCGNKDWRNAGDDEVVCLHCSFGGRKPIGFELLVWHDNITSCTSKYPLKYTCCYFYLHCNVGLLPMKNV